MSYSNGPMCQDNPDGYWVHVTHMSAPASTKYGPFSERATAEACTVTLASRTDVMCAQIKLRNPEED